MGCVERARQWGRHRLRNLRERSPDRDDHRHHLYRRQSDGRHAYTFAVAALDAAGASAESNPISVHTAPASPRGPGSGGYVHEFSPYIDMAMPADADLSAISAASGIHNFTLASVLSSASGIGWQVAGTISDDPLAN